MQTTCSVHCLALSSTLYQKTCSHSAMLSSFSLPSSFALFFSLFFFFFFFLWPRFSVLPLLALLGKSWHQFWLQISWAARLHHVKIAIFLYLCRAIFKGSKVWRSRLAAWQERAHGYQHTGIWRVHSDRQSVLGTKGIKKKKKKKLQIYFYILQAYGHKTSRNIFNYWSCALSRNNVPTAVPYFFPP